MKTELTPEQIAQYQATYSAMRARSAVRKEQEAVEAVNEAEVEVLVQRPDKDTQAAALRRMRPSATKYDIKPSPVEEALIAYDGLPPDPDDPNEKALAALKQCWLTNKSAVEEAIDTFDQENQHDPLAVFDEPEPEPETQEPIAPKHLLQIDKLISREIRSGVTKINSRKDIT